VHLRAAGLGPSRTSRHVCFLRCYWGTSGHQAIRSPLCPAHYCSGLPVLRAKMHPPAMGTKSRETIYGASVRAAAERAEKARREADRLACEAWNKRMLGFQGPAQPPPTLGDALNAGYSYLEVRCLGCDTHQTVVRQPKATPVHEREDTDESRHRRCLRRASVDLVFSARL
jgi:hypothetical protein